MTRLTRRRLGALLLIVAGLTALVIPLLFRGIPPTGTTSPPPPGRITPSGGNGGGAGGSNGSGANPDTSPPLTTISIAGPFLFPRGNNDYYYPNFTITLHATDDTDLSMILLNDTGRVHRWSASGTSANVTWTVTDSGRHQLGYWSVDKAGNKETPNDTTVRVTKPDFSDLLSLIADSKIDNAGVRNALSTKVQHAQDEQASGHSPDSLNALSNQVSALSGKHGLDQDLANLLLSIINIIIG